MAKPIENLPKEFIAATGSERRRKALKDITAWITEQGFSQDSIKVHNISPDSDAGIDESPSTEAGEVAWEKALVVALALGMVKEDQVPDELLEKWTDIITLDSKERDISLGQNIAVFGGDVVTLVSHDPGADAQQHEVLKLERQLTEDPVLDKEIIAKDKARIMDLYTRPEGFYVMYKLGIAFLGSDEENKVGGITAAWDVILKYKPLDRSVVEMAYGEGGEAYWLGPRIDLTKLYPSKGDDDFGIFVRNADAGKDGVAEEPWKPLELEVLRMLVGGGLLPPHLCIKLLAEFAQSNMIKEGKIEPTRIRMDISTK